MNSILKAAVTINGLRSLLSPVKNVTLISAFNQQKQIQRYLWYINSFKEDKMKGVHREFLGNCGHGSSCSCRSSRFAHTKAERELVEFLTEEILAERKAQKVKTIPTEFDGFKASLDGAEVTFEKQIDDEIIKITLNVNHSVDTDAEPEIHEKMDKPDIGELKSKPGFKIELLRGNTTVSLLCSYNNPQEHEEEYNDIFGIDEISIYEGDWNENVYAVSGEVVDSYLYDLILNYLEEKGISNEFVEKLSNYSTAYEHSAYISLLEGLSKFVSKK